MQNTSAAFLMSLNGVTQSVCGFVLENMNENYKYIITAFIHGSVSSFIDDLMLYCVLVNWLGRKRNSSQIKYN
jgi:hypothetical protein